MVMAKQFTRPASGIRFEFKGMNFTLPPDALPPGKYAYAQNCRAYKQGLLRTRLPQGTPVLTIGGGQALHSLKRLNDTTGAGPVSGFAYIVGRTVNLYRDNMLVASGLSGRRLSMASFRPNASPQPWMYVADSNKIVKVNAVSTVSQNAGIAEPQTALLTEIGGKQHSTLNEMADATQWTKYGAVFSVPSSALRFTTAFIIALPDFVISSGSSGPSTIAVNSLGAGIGGISVNELVFINNIPVLVESIPTTPANTSITSLIYDTGTTGLCNIVTAGVVNVAAKGGCFLLGGISPEYVQIISVALNPGGTTSTVRCRTLFTHFPGDAMTGTPAFRTSDSLPFQVGAFNVTDSYVAQTTTGPGTGGMTTKVASAPGSLQGRVVEPTDLLHVQIWTDVHTDITSCTITLNLDPNVIDYSTNALQWTIAGGSITANGIWLDLSIAVGSLTRLGTDTSLDLTTGVNGIRVQWVIAGVGIVSLLLGDLNIVGSYGPQVTAQETSLLYRFRWRSTQTGAKSNPSPVQRVGVRPNAQSVFIQGQTSPDAQADVMDIYRQGGGTLDYTYIGTLAANPNLAFRDDLDDPTIAVNPLLEFDNFEPFPSIDLPRSGVVNVAGHIVTWVSGDAFNVRWAPGVVITIDGVDRHLYKRPTNTTTLETLEALGTGSNLAYQIKVPTLLDQPMPALWGPTDNEGFFFACGDPLRPGTLYYTKGNDPDSAPDTNQLEATSPSEPLMNGCIVNGLALVFSTERAWFIYPNFSNVLATVTGTVGNPFKLIQSINDRGLYARQGICTDGGGNVYFIAKDSVRVSKGGSGSTSITDEDLFPLFPHEGMSPSPQGVGVYTVNPPDYNNPDGMLLSFADGYLYFDYKDVGGMLWSLVYDPTVQGWSVDSYINAPVSVHANEDGIAIGTIMGCSDGTIRLYDSSAGGGGGGAPAGTDQMIVATQAYDNGELRADKMWGDVYLEAILEGGRSISAILASNRYSLIYSPGLVPSTFFTSAPGLRDSFVLEISPTNLPVPATRGVVAKDIAIILTTPVSNVTALALWQPCLIPQPESTEGRVTDWGDLGTPGMKFIQGFLIECDTGNVNKTFKVQSGDDLSFSETFTVRTNGQSILPFSFTNPILAHTVRIVPQDAVVWKVWGVNWVFVPAPELVPVWQTEGISHGLPGWQHEKEMVIAHQSTSDLTLTLTPDVGVSISVTVPHSAGRQTKTLVILPANKFKIVSYRITSAAPFRLWLEDVEVKVGEWGRQDGYKVVRPFGGPSAASALI